MRKYALCIVILAFMSVFAFRIQAANLIIDPSTQESPAVGEMLTVGVKVEYITGLYGYQLEVVFDSTALKFLSIEEGEFLGSDGTSTFAFLKFEEQWVNFKDVTPDMAADVNAAGVLSIVSTRYGNDANISGTGDLAAITFEVLEVKDSTLELQNAKMANSDAEVIPVDLENGAVKAPAGIRGDVNNDGEIRSNDAILALRLAAGLIEPTDYQRWAADINEDGEVRSNDAIIILRKAAGLAAPSVSAAASTGRHITATLAEAHGVAGETITVPVKVDNTYGLAGGDVSISYDRVVLRAVDVSSDSVDNELADHPASGILLASNINDPGIVRIAFANGDRLNSETIATVRFEILADDVSPLSFKSVGFYNPDGLPLPSRAIDREFSSWAIPPEQSALLQNFPNPLNPETWIPYQLKNAGEVAVRIYNAAGELIRELDLGYRSAGLYVTPDRAAHWDGKSKFGTPVASGVYFYSIQAGDFIAVRKLIVLK